MESLILRIVKLKGNRVKGKFVKSRDLRRQFTRDIRSEYNKRIASLLGRQWNDPQVRQNDEETSGRSPALAEFFSAPKRLRAIHKGKTLKAKVRRDGRIRFAGKVYDSPSAAGAAALGRRCNGWRFWRYERAPGDWLTLNELRK
jgi:Restriction Enzyme Adenine Methylase Associated